MSFTVGIKRSNRVVQQGRISGSRIKRGQGELFVFPPPTNPVADGFSARRQDLCVWPSLYRVIHLAFGVARIGKADSPRFGAPDRAALTGFGKNRPASSAHLIGADHVTDPVDSVQSVQTP